MDNVCSGLHVLFLPNGPLMLTCVVTFLGRQSIVVGRYCPFLRVCLSSQLQLSFFHLCSPASLTAHTAQHERYY